MSCAGRAWEENSSTDYDAAALAELVAHYF
jgi:hypothetical protein